jgi:hypothetical protein
MVSSLAFIIQAGFGRAFSFKEDRVESSSAMVLLIILLLGFSFFFGKFVDINYMEVGG